MSRRSLCVVSCPGEVSVCVIMCCDSLCVPEEPPCVRHCCVSRWSHRVCVGLLVDAYQCRQLSAQLAPPSFIGKDVIVQGPYLGVCFKIKMFYRYYSSYIPSCCFSTRSCKLLSVSNYAFKKKKKSSSYHLCSGLAV